MVGCTTCANTCPAHAIMFPPIETVLALEGLAVVRHAVEDDLMARHDVLAATVPVPHPDRIVTLKVVSKTQLTADVLDVVLAPVQTGACFLRIRAGTIYRAVAARLGSSVAVLFHRQRADR
jgi:CDP-4-dehydro-6-deoxyglucose reductase